MHLPSHGCIRIHLVNSTRSFSGALTVVGRLPTKCQNRRSLGVEGYPRPPARAETRALTSRAAAASAASTPMGDQTAALTAALTEAIVAALQPLLQRTPWGDPLIAEDSDQGGWIRDGAQYYGEEYFWLPPGQTPRQWREVHRQMREQQQLHAKEVQPQPEPDEGAAAATAAAAVLAAATLAAKAELAIQRAVEDEEAIVHIARAGAQPGRAAATAEWPELPATCVPPPTTPSRGEPGRRAQGRARARARRAVASLAAASTAAATAAAVAAAAAIVVSVSDTTPEAASAADAAVDHEESTAAAHSGLGLIEQGAMVCLQRTDPLGLWGPVGAWADEPCPLYVKLEVQAASASAQDATCDFLGSPQAANGAVCGATGAPGAGGDASPNAQDAICAFSGSLQAANGAVCGATGAPGAGGDASPSAQDAICTFSGSLQAANGAVCGATGAPGAGGDASPSAQDATCDFSGSLQATNGAVCGATRAPGAGGDASPNAQDAICAFSGSLQAANGAVCGATGAPGAGGDASPSAQDAICAFSGSLQAANGAVCGATGAPGAGGDASPSAQDAICTFSGSLQAANGAVCGATGAPGAGGDASPSAQDATCDFSGSLQAANGAVCGATKAPGAGGEASPGAQDAICAFSGSLQAANGAVCGATGAPGAGGDASPSAQAPPPCLALTQCPGASGGCIVFEEVFQGGGRQQEMLEDEVCTRACIEELQVATLELLMGSFREGGLRLSAPPSPINLSPNPPPGRLPCAAPWGSDSVSSGGGWGLTPPLHCPRPSLLPPRPRGQGRGGVAALPPSLRGPLAQPTSGGNGGALPVARAAGLPVSGGAQLAFVSASPVMSRAREPPPCDPSPRSGHKVRTWGEGDHNRPLPQVHPAAPALELGQSVSATASPEEVHVGTSASTAAGPAKEAWGVGIPDRPLPPSWPQAAARAVLGHSPGGGHAPPAGGKEAPAPAHQGGSRVPVMVHGRASSEVT